MACISAVYEEAEFRWRSATVVSSTEKAKPTLFFRSGTIREAEDRISE